VLISCWFFGRGGCLVFDWEMRTGWEVVDYLPSYMQQILGDQELMLKVSISFELF
jgi:hypothetical protein